MDALLTVRDLDVRLFLKEGVVRALNGVSFSIAPNRTLGLVGESGCGKTIAARAVLRILPSRAQIAAGSIQLAPRRGSAAAVPVELTELDANGPAIRRIRGGDISMVFQEPMSSLSPVHTVGEQIGEAVRLHQGLSRRNARACTIETLRRVGIPRAEQTVDAYPHQLSGGLRQRCMIAMALCCRPRLLIADEPTTALDVTIQYQILELIRSLQAEFGMAVLIITHDLGVIAETADDVAVMYLGRIVEQAAAGTLFGDPKHPYTHGLLASAPRLGRGNRERLASIPGSVPNPFSVVRGCPFHPRCRHAIRGRCDEGLPPDAVMVGPGHTVACHLYDAPSRSLDEEREGDT